MTRILSTIVALAWALWLGGLIALFLTLPTIFRTPGYSQAQQGEFAARLFPMFERVQLACAAAALLATTAWWLAARARPKLVLFTLFAVATMTAVVETAMVTPRVEELRVSGRRGTPEFDRMHKLSTRVYMSGAIVLLIAGFVLPSAIRADALKPPRPPQTSEETAPA